MDDIGQPDPGSTFQLQATDPDGKKYFLHASPTTATAFPIMLGGADGPATSGLFGVVNRLLARVQPAVKEEEGACLQVYVEALEDPVQLDFEPTMREARDLAASIVHDIEAGVFVPRGFH